MNHNLLPQEFLQRLEASAAIVMAPPHTVGHSTRQEAEQVFLEFRRMKNAFHLCRSLLDLNPSSFVAREIAVCLKNGIITDWNSLSSDQHRPFLEFLLVRAHDQSRQLENYVREELLLVAAILLKRMAIDATDRLAAENGGRRRVLMPDGSKVEDTVLKPVLESACGALTDPNTSTYNKSVAAAFLLAILREYSSTTRASDFGLPWIKHLHAKKTFELDYLKGIFNQVISALNMKLNGTVVIDHILQDAEEFRLVSKLLEICEQILTWKFDLITILSSQVARNADSVELPTLQPPVDWLDVFVNSSVVPFFFNVFLALRDTNEQLVHKSLQCLNQVSTLNGGIFNQRENKLKFITMLTTATINLVQHILQTIKPSECLQITSVIYRITCNYQQRNVINDIDREQCLHPFLNIMAQLFYKLMIESVKTDWDSEDSERFKQAIDNMCDSWMSVINAIERATISPPVGSDVSSPIPSPLQLSLLEPFANEMFACYLKCHLCQPEGFRLVDHVTDEDEEILDFEEDDRTLYADQLNTIGTLARLNLDNSLECLFHLLSTRISQYEAFLSSLIHNGGGQIDSKAWTNLNEDIHWLVMISAAVLTQSNYGERDLIPEEVLRHCIRKSADIARTCQALQSLQHTVDNIDPVVRIIIIVLKFCSIEMQVSEARRSDLISPEVASTVGMFISQFCQGYLLPDETLYQEISLTLSSCFGLGAPAASYVLNLVLQLSLSRLVFWSGEARLTEETSMFLVRFVQYSPDRSKAVLKSPIFETLVERHKAREFHSLSVATRKNIYQFLTMVISHQQNLYPAVFEPLRARFISVSFKMAKNEYHEEKVRQELTEFYDCLAGIASAIDPSNVEQLWGGFLKEYFDMLPGHVDKFHNYSVVIGSILELLLRVTDRVLCFLAEPHVTHFYQTCVRLLETYSHYNRGKASREAGHEEETHQDILMILRFLEDLSNKDFIEWVPVSQEETTPALRVVLTGLDIIMPLMNEELLKYPPLCDSYYKLVQKISEDCDRVVEINGHLLTQILASIELALKSTFSIDVKCNCLSMISNFGNHVARDRVKFQGLAMLLNPFLATLLSLTLTEFSYYNDITLRDNLANALFTLMTCFPDSHQSLIAQLVQQQPDPQTQHQLQLVFQELLKDVPLELNRQTRAKFKQHFETFVINLQGLICIK